MYYYSEENKTIGTGVKLGNKYVNQSPLTNELQGDTNLMECVLLIKKEN